MNEGSQCKGSGRAVNEGYLISQCKGSGRAVNEIWSSQPLLAVTQSIDDLYCPL